MSDVNKQLLEALKLADAMLEGANMNANVVERKVKSAIAAAEQGQHGQSPFSDVIAMQRCEVVQNPSDAYMVGLYNGMTMMDANYRNSTEFECLAVKEQQAEPVQTGHCAACSIETGTVRPCDICGVQTAATQQQAEPVARIKTVGGYPDDSRHELELLVKHGQLYDGQLLYAAQPPAVAVPDGSIEAVAAGRYKVVPSHESMFYRFAVVAGDGEQQLYLGRKVECENMARRFSGAFLDGAFAYQQITEPAGQPADVTVPNELTCEDIERLRLALSWEGYSTPESLEACATRWPSLVRDLIAGVLDRKKRTQAAAQKGGK